MGTNSILANIKKDRLITEIGLKLSADIKHEKVFVVVEGDDDVAFFKEKVASNTTIASTGGRAKADEVVRHFNKNQVFGICDRDYQQIQGNPRIFYYDYCNLEMMLVSNDVVMQQITGNFYRGMLSHIALRQKILQELKWLSVFRQYREQHLPQNAGAQQGWNINFKEISISNMIDANGNFQQTVGVMEINAHSDNFIHNHPVEYQQMLQQYNSASNQLQDLLMITQGHDFVKAFEHFCSAASTPAPRKGAVEHSLRCAYRMSDFQQTALYSALKAYEQKTSLPILSA